MDQRGTGPRALFSAILSAKKTARAHALFSAKKSTKTNTKRALVRARAWKIVLILCAEG